MADLLPIDVDNYTGGRLDATDPETARMLSAALVVGRNEVGWHVSPALTVTVTLDGPDSTILWLPTPKLNALTSVTEDGTALDVTKISKSVGDGTLPRRRVALRKQSGGWWSAEYGSIVVAMNHGFTEAEAVDWRQAILSMVDQMSLLPVKAATGSSAFGLSAKRVDDVQYNWGNPYMAAAEEVLFSFTHILCNYKLPDLEYF